MTFLEKFFALIVSIFAWWGAHTPSARKTMRLNFIIFALICIIAYLIINHNIVVKTLENNFTIKLNSKQRELDAFKETRLQEIIAKNTKLEKVNSIKDSLLVELKVRNKLENKD